MPRARAVKPLPTDDESALDGSADKGFDADPVPRAARTRTARKPRARATTTRRGSIGQRDTSGRIMSKAAQVAKVKEELYLWASLFIGGWELKDPECAAPWFAMTNVGGVQRERLEAFVDRITTMIARNDKWLAVVANSGAIGDAAMLGGLAWPALKVVVKHHGPTGIGHQVEDTDAYADQYPPYRTTATVA